MRYLVSVAVALVLLAGSAWAEDKSKFKTDKERFSYTIGYNLGARMKTDGLDIDPKVFQEAVADALAGKKSVLNEKERQQAMMDLRKQVTERQKKDKEEQGKKNLTQGKAYREDYKNKEGVKSTKSGILYKVIKSGTGKSAKADQTVTVHYRGKLIDGKEFDSSFKRKKPATFPVKGVIKGWQEIIPMMKEGGKWEVVIPSELAYGLRGGGDRIGPNATLVFDIELIKVNPKLAAPKPKKITPIKPKAMPKAKPEKK